MAESYNRSLRHVARQLLGEFFRSLESLEPWWFSIVSPVNGECKTSLTNLIGFDHQVGLQFLCSAGLLKTGPKKNSYSVQIEQWELFIVQERLTRMMETINRTSISGSKYFFINIGNKEKLEHRPLDQFNGRKPTPSKVFDISARRRKFHQQLSDALLSLRENDAWRNEINNNIVIDSINELSDEESFVASQQPSDTLWADEHVLLDEKKHPNTFKMFQSDGKAPRCLLRAVFCELLSILGGNNNTVDFTYLNGRKGRAVIIPMAKSLSNFMDQARKLRWIDSILDHIVPVGNDKDDAAEWMSFFLGKKHDGAFTLASEALGLPLVQRLDDASAQAMWSDANINVTQQRIIKKHLRYHFGKRLFIPDQHISNDVDHYNVHTTYGEFKFYKKGDRTQKAERCSYWCRDASIVVSNELARLIDHSFDTLKSSSNLLSSIARNCTIISGADHGQGAWRSWVKIYTMSENCVQEEMAADPTFDQRKTYITSQVGHITCKKDHPEILLNSVSPHLSTAYEKLLSSMLVFISVHGEKKVRAIYLSRHATDINIENGALTYSIKTTNECNGFSMRVSEEEKLPTGSNIIFIISSFDLFITGDLSYYADVLGMPSSTSFWCPWCLLSRNEWKQSADVNGDERTSEFQNNAYLAICNDIEKKMTPSDRKGVTSEMHYKALTPQHFVPPLLHLQIGMVNQAWDTFEEWIDNFVEVIPEHEKDARNNVKEAFKLHNDAVVEKKEADKTINIDIREKNAELKVLRAALRRKGLSESEMIEIKTRVTLLETYIMEQRESMKRLKENAMKAAESLAKSKQLLQSYKEERGKPESSLMADIELILERFSIQREAYHGGDFNGVCCRRIVGNGSEIIRELRKIVKKKKDASCEDFLIDKTLDEFEITLGLLDAAYAYLNVPFPNEECKSKATKATIALAKHWRSAGFNMTLKAHIIEKHVCNFNEKWGIGDKEESFIEQGHQIGIKDNRRYAGLTNFEKKSASTLKARAAATHPTVLQCRKKVAEHSKRKKLNNDTEGMKRIKREQVKAERDSQRDSFITESMNSK